MNLYKEKTIVVCEYSHSTVDGYSIDKGSYGRINEVQPDNTYEISWSVPSSVSNSGFIFKCEENVGANLFTVPNSDALPRIIDYSFLPIASLLMGTRGYLANTLTEAQNIISNLSQCIETKDPVRCMLIRNTSKGAQWLFTGVNIRTNRSNKGNFFIPLKPLNKQVAKATFSDEVSDDCHDNKQDIDVFSSFENRISSMFCA